LDLLNNGKIAGAAIDPAGASIFDASNDFYKELLSHPKVIATPHIAFHNDMTIKKANDIMIDNVEAWVKKKPINVVN
jgi:phosphoglycerate dehydrogenase-like enzyme